MAATTTLSGHRPLSNLSPLRTLGSAGAVNLFFFDPYYFNSAVQ